MSHLNDICHRNGHNVESQSQKESCHRKQTTSDLVSSPVPRMLEPCPRSQYIFLCSRNAVPLPLPSFTSCISAKDNLMIKSTLEKTVMVRGSDIVSTNELADCIVSRPWCPCKRCLVWIPWLETLLTLFIPWQSWSGIPCFPYCCDQRILIGASRRIRYVFMWIVSCVCSKFACSCLITLQLMSEVCTSQGTSKTSRAKRWKQC